MRLGAALTPVDITSGQLGSDSFADASRVIEQLGYSSIWTFDAVGRGFMLPDPLMALAVAAGSTHSVELGTGIMQLPIRNVAEVAHRLFTLELLAPGRVLFGVGPGSTRADFEVFGRDYENRFADFDRQWRELQEIVESGQFDGRDFFPWPQVKGQTALLLAGWRGRWVDRAAAEASGWIASAANATDEQLADSLARYRNAGGQRAVVTTIQVGAEIEPTIDRLHQLAELGFDDGVVADFAATEDRLAAIREGFRV